MLALMTTLVVAGSMLLAVILTCLTGIILLGMSLTHSRMMQAERLRHERILVGDPDPGDDPGENVIRLPILDLSRYWM